MLVIVQIRALSITIADDIFTVLGLLIWYDNVSGILRSVHLGAKSCVVHGLRSVKGCSLMTSRPQMTGELASESGRYYWRRYIPLARF